MIICKHDQRFSMMTGKPDRKILRSDHLRCDFCGEIFHHDFANCVTHYAISISDGVDLCIGIGDDEQELTQLLESASVEIHDVLLEPFVFCELWCSENDCQKKISQKVIEETQTSFFDAFRLARVQTMIRLIKENVIKPWQLGKPGT